MLDSPAHRPFRLLLQLALCGLLLVVSACEDVGDDSGAGDNPSPTPDQPDNQQSAPSLVSVDEIDLDPPAFSVGATEIDGQDYILSLTSTEGDGDTGGIALRVNRRGDDGQLKEISTLEAPVAWSTYLTRAGIGPISIDNDVLFIPLIEGEQAGLWTVDLSDSEAPEELGYIETNHLGPSMAISDGLLAMTGYFGGEVGLYDVSEPESPEIVGSFEASAPTRPVLTIEGTSLYMIHGRGLSIVDVSDPSQPAEVGFYDNPDWDGPDASTGSRDISQSSPEEMTEQIAAVGTYSDVVVSGDYAYVSAGYREILILDVSEPSSPTEVGRFERDDHTHRITRAGDFLYVLGAEAVEDEETNLRLRLSLEAIDISDPENPALVDRLEDFASDFESAAFALLVQHFDHGGDSLIAYGNMPSAYLAHIDWVEASEETATSTSTPTMEPVDDSEQTSQAPNEPTQASETRTTPASAEDEVRALIEDDLSIEEIYQWAEESLNREDMIYHATITTDAAEESFLQGGSRELWIDANRNLVRTESTRRLELEDTSQTFNTTGIIAGGAQHTLYEGPGGRVDGTRASRCYGASEAVSGMLGCPGALERSTTTVEAGDYLGQPAAVLVTTGTSRGSDETFDFTSRHYLDPKTFLPIAEETEGDHTYGPVDIHSVYEHEFIERDAIPEGHFDPVSLALSRLDSADVDIPVHWLGREFASAGDLPAVVLADGGVPDVPDAGYDFGLSYRLPDPTFASSETLRSEVVIQGWSREEWEASAGPAFQAHWEERCHETIDVAMDNGQATIHLGHGESVSPAQPAYNMAPPSPSDPGPEECPDSPFTRFEAVAEFDEAVLFISAPGESEYQSQAGLEAVLHGLEMR